MVPPRTPNRLRPSDDTKAPRPMETINRFSASSSEPDSRPPSISSRFSVSDLRRSLQTPVSSTLAVNDPQSSTDSRVGHSLDNDTASSLGSEDVDEWIRHLPNDLGDGEFSDALPTETQLQNALDIPIYDAEGTSRPFRNLYQGAEYQGQRQLIIFVRHFYCGVCQAYIKCLTDTITPTRYFSLPTPTTITIIGCGRPALLAKYLKRTSCPFRMYSEPTRKLYKALGMPISWTMGKKTAYHDLGQWAITKDTFGQMIKAGRRAGTSGGHLLQIGGEYLFENGKPIWCHRMRVIRGHAEMNVIARVLEMESESIRVAREDGGAVEMSAVGRPSSRIDATTRTVKPARSMDDGGLREPPPALIRSKARTLIWDDKGDDVASRAARPER